MVAGGNSAAAATAAAAAADLFIATLPSHDCDKAGFTLGPFCDKVASVVVQTCLASTFHFTLISLPNILLNHFI